MVNLDDSGPGSLRDAVSSTNRTIVFDISGTIYLQSSLVVTNSYLTMVGQTAPDFTLMNQEKKEVKLSDFAGKKNVVLVWYPLDWSPTCTNEHACFVNEMKAFETLDAEVLGVSVDSVWSHKAYDEKMGIKYSNPRFGVLL